LKLSFVRRKKNYRFEKYEKQKFSSIFSKISILNFSACLQQMPRQLQNLYRRLREGLYFLSLQQPGPERPVSSNRLIQKQSTILDTFLISECEDMMKVNLCYNVLEFCEVAVVADYCCSTCRTNRLII